MIIMSISETTTIGFIKGKANPNKLKPMKTAINNRIGIY